MTPTDSLADIHVTRRAQLRMLIDQRAAGNIAAFADQFGYSRSRVSQFLSDTYNEGRSIGERAARALEEVAGVPFGWLDQIPAKTAFDEDRVRKISETVTIDHAAELRGAIAQTRLVFEGHRDAQDALEYLEQVLKAGQRAEVPAHACTPEAGAAVAMAAESAQLVIQAEKAAAGAAARATVDPVAVLSREVFSLSNKLQQPADLVVQLLVLAELRGMRAEQASDRFARGAAVLS